MRDILRQPLAAAYPRLGRKPVLALDCDGVLYQLHEGLLERVINPALGTNITPDQITTWGWETQDPRARQMFYDELRGPSAWYLGEPYPDVVRDTQRLAEHYDIVIVTAMSPKFESERRAWLEIEGIPYQRLIVTRDKAKAALEVGASAAVEDYAINANALGMAGIPTWLVARPYNGMDTLDMRRVQRGPWSECVQWLLSRVGVAA